MTSDAMEVSEKAEKLRKHPHYHYLCFCGSGVGTMFVVLVVVLLSLIACYFVGVPIYKQSLSHKHDDGLSVRWSNESTATATTVQGADEQEAPNIRTGNTTYDRYYQKHKKLPVPANPHVILNAAADSTITQQPQRVLVIGDVHGCLDELQMLVQKAQMNHSFHSIILVGDLVNKGPYSKQVLDYVQQQQQKNDSSHTTTQWHVIRGNHEHNVLEVAFDEHHTNNKKKKKHKKKYDWMFHKHNQSSVLSDKDIAFMAELPYTITIPAEFFGTNHNYNTSFLIVHAGILPEESRPLSQQDYETMVTIRDVKVHDKSGSSSYYEAVEKHKKDSKLQSWAHYYHSPLAHIIFGHDAKRSLQFYENATGIDSGCVYGRQLTGMILPERTLVQVDALQTYSER